MTRSIRERVFSRLSTGGLRHGAQGEPATPQPSSGHETPESEGYVYLPAREDWGKKASRPLQTRAWDWLKRGHTDGETVFLILMIGNLIALSLGIAAIMMSS